ncbi:MAG TPA: alanine dehydrogenase [Candidatus Lokiarchaeia archaeon]|nr:alanine dehydrogenase [Candidatus Lokiarchaeia archaeon]
MRIGVPKEIKTQENRVGLTPQNVPDLAEAGHEVIVETRAGEGSGFSDEEYAKEGATILSTPAEVYDQADMIVKVKEPLDSEIPLLRTDQILFTFLHLAGNEQLTHAVLQSGITGIAYETIEEEGGRLPLLAPMSVIAGRMAPIVGSYYLGKHLGGMGKLIGGAFGIPHGHIVVLGGGVAGLAAAKISAGLGAIVTVLEVNPARISYLEDILPQNVAILKSNQYNIRTAVSQADVLIGTVLIPGAPAPKLVSEDMVKQMQQGSVIVDISIDQGGCVATSHPTTHDDPVFVRDGVVHYCVANMPGAYPHTSTLALTNATLPYALAIANAEQDWQSLFSAHPPLAKGVNVFKGHLTCGPVAAAFNLPCEDVGDLL